MIATRMPMFVGLILAVLASRVPAQDADEVTVYLHDRKPLKAVFRNFADDYKSAVVSILKDGEPVALGTIVAADGWVLTKASELPPSPKAKLADGRDVSAKLVGVDERHDLALLRLDAEELAFVELSEKRFQAGQWVVTVGHEPLPLGVGVVSVAPRKISSDNGYLGVMLGQVEKNSVGVPVDQVMPDTAAENAGLKVGDRILIVAGKPAKTREALIEVIRNHDPGDKISLQIERASKDGAESEKKDLEIVLGKRREEEEASGARSQRRRRGRQLRSRGLSTRRNGFESAMQHDTSLLAVDCGSPVIDIDGRIVAINIARSGRTQCLAVPAAVAKDVFEKLKLKSKKVSKK